MTGFGFLVLAAPILFVGAAAPRPVTHRAPGLSYDFVLRLSRTTQDGKIDRGYGVRGHASVLGDHVRVDFDEHAAPPGMTGSYFLSNDAGAHAIIVAADKHQTIEMSMPALVKKFSNSSGNFGGLLNQATDVNVDVQDLGAGPDMFGQPTKHDQLVEVKTINGNVRDAAQHERDSVIVDLFYAPGLQNLINPFVSEPPFAGRMDGLGPEDMQRYLAARAKLYPGLAPLRAVTRETTTDANGKSVKFVLTVMITRMESTDVDQSIFEIPEDYSKTTLQGPQ
ncbi:MAG TPA: hypothetical protein VLI40_09030 [Gemmatimonadaceae bacterium]|nr:hypothetical protein [Gemmatimonadaceae bacterium]